MLADDKTRAAHFLSAEKKNDDGEKKNDDGAGARAHAVFLGLLASPDWFTREKAVFCLTRLIDQRPARDKKLGLRAEDREGAEDVVLNENESVAGAATIRLVRWLCRELTAPAPSHTTRAVPACVAALASLLPSARFGPSRTERAPSTPSLLCSEETRDRTTSRRSTRLRSARGSSLSTRPRATRWRVWAACAG